MPDPRSNCGPYHRPVRSVEEEHKEFVNEDISSNHDTIGMVIVDGNGDVSVGTSTNGASHKVPGSVTIYYYSQIKLMMGTGLLFFFSSWGTLKYSASRCPGR